MNDYMLVRMRIAELIGQAEEARLAKRAGRSAGKRGRPRVRLAWSPMLAAAGRWRWRNGALGPGRGLGSWAPVNDGKVRRTH
jgi:hypothetical protein